MEDKVETTKTGKIDKMKTLKAKAARVALATTVIGAGEVVLEKFTQDNTGKGVISHVVDDVAGNLSQRIGGIRADAPYSETEIARDTESIEIMTHIERTYGTNIKMPQTFEQEGEEILNLGWPKEAIIKLYEAMALLPPSYHEQLRKSNVDIILLMNPASTEFVGIRGGYMHNNIILELPVYFNADRELPVELSKFFSNEGELVIFATIHEFSHYFLEDHPGLLDDWASTMGWAKDEEGVWINSNPQDISPIGGANTNPSEDFSVTIGYIAIGSDLPSSNRVQFLKDHPFFNTWHTLEEYIANH